MREMGPERRRSPAFSLSQVLQGSDDILELLPVAVCICDLEGRIVQYNSRAVRIWGRTPKPGETHEHFAAEARFYGAEGERLPEIRVSKVLKSGQPVRNEEMLVDQADGSSIAVLIDIDPLLDARGQMVGLVSCFQDITERKRVYEALEKSQQELRQQQERWNATYEHAAIGIVEIDADGAFLRVNEIDLRHHRPDPRRTARLEVVRAYASGRSRRRRGSLSPPGQRRDRLLLDRKALRAQGRPGDLVLDPLLDGARCAGNFLYGVRVVQDITARKEAEDRQKLLMDELNHRVKNTLATVQSLAAQTARGTDFSRGVPPVVRRPADRAEPCARSAHPPALDQRRPARHRHRRGCALSHAGAGAGR